MSLIKILTTLRRNLDLAATTLRAERLAEAKRREQAANRAGLEALRSAQGRTLRDQLDEARGQIASLWGLLHEARSERVRADGEIIEWLQHLADIPENTAVRPFLTAVIAALEAQRHIEFAAERRGDQTAAIAETILRRGAKDESPDAVRPAPHVGPCKACDGDHLGEPCCDDQCWHRGPVPDFTDS